MIFVLSRTVNAYFLYIRFRGWKDCLDCRSLRTMRGALGMRYEEGDVVILLDEPLGDQTEEISDVAYYLESRGFPEAHVVRTIG